MKTRVFRGLGSSERVAKRATEAQMLSREAVNRELEARQSRKFLCDFVKNPVFV